MMMMMMIVLMKKHREIMQCLPAIFRKGCKLSGDPLSRIQSIIDRIPLNYFTDR